MLRRGFRAEQAVSRAQRGGQAGDERMPPPIAHEHRAVGRVAVGDPGSGRIAADLEVEEWADMYFGEDAGRYRRTIATKLYNEPIDIFDHHLYEKGGRVLHMLRHELGEDLYRKCIRAYLERHPRVQLQLVLGNSLASLTRREADVAVRLDGDGQHDPAEIGLITGPVSRGEADVVLGGLRVEELLAHQP